MCPKNKIQKMSMFTIWFDLIDKTLMTSAPDVLQYLEVQTISIVDCKRYYDYMPQKKFVHNSTICTIGKGNGPCVGDSGE